MNGSPSLLFYHKANIERYFPCIYNYSSSKQSLDLYHVFISREYLYNVEYFQFLPCKLVHVCIFNYYECVNLTTCVYVQSVKRCMYFKPRFRQLRIKGQFYVQFAEITTQRAICKNRFFTYHVNVCNKIMPVLKQIM